METLEKMAKKEIKLTKKQIDQIEEKVQQTINKYRLKEKTTSNQTKSELHVASYVPIWFYLGSIFAAYLFTIYISIFATIHFDNIEFMNITIVFLFISLVSFFLISAIFFISEKKFKHSIAPIIFFIGVVSIMAFAFKAVDTSSLVRFSIIYTIIVAGISVYVLAIRR